MPDTAISHVHSHFTVFFTSREPPIGSCTFEPSHRASVFFYASRGVCMWWDGVSSGEVCMEALLFFWMMVDWWIVFGVFLSTYVGREGGYWMR